MPAVGRAEAEESEVRGQPGLHRVNLSKQQGHHKTPKPKKLLLFSFLMNDPYSVSSYYPGNAISAEIELVQISVFLTSEVTVPMCEIPNEDVSTPQRPQDNSGRPEGCRAILHHCPQLGFEALSSAQCSGASTSSDSPSCSLTLCAVACTKATASAPPAFEAEECG